jgi:hypothetical protein
MKNKTLAELQEEQRVAEKALRKIEKEIGDKLSRTVVLCKNSACRRGYEIRELDYIQTYWYEQPSGCMDGDRWHPGEGQWKCPVCGTVERLYNQPDIEALKHRFKSIIKQYKD